MCWYHRCLSQLVWLGWEQPGTIAESLWKFLTASLPTPSWSWHSLLRGALPGGWRTGPCSPWPCRCWVCATGRSPRTSAAWACGSRGTGGRPRGWARACGQVTSWSATAPASLRCCGCRRGSRRRPGRAATCRRAPPPGGPRTWLPCPRLGFLELSTIQPCLRPSGLHLMLRKPPWGRSPAAPPPPGGGAPSSCSPRRCARTGRRCCPSGRRSWGSLRCPLPPGPTSSSSITGTPDFPQPTLWGPSSRSFFGSAPSSPPQ
mmetsp:Transcript_2006/g.3351  ORF Transcript_2006/g.3351 Transcript_2006/m.3351 type:complete len:260 (+) Transcript_2006:232-1011(+)